MPAYYIRREPQASGGSCFSERMYYVMSELYSAIHIKEKLVSRASNHSKSLFERRILRCEPASLRLRQLSVSVRQMHAPCLCDSAVDPSDITHDVIRGSGIAQIAVFLRDIRTLPAPMSTLITVFSLTLTAI